MEIAVRAPLAAALAFLAAACTAPRTVLLSPDALPKGHWQLGASMDGNIPVETSRALYGSLEEGVDALYDRNGEDGPAAITADSLNGLALAMVAYAIDPLTTQTGMFVRYGFWPRLDGGYHYSGGAHGLDVRWQFLGPMALDSVAPGQSRWQGSVGLQYSWQEFELPDILGLAKLQDLLRFEFKRKNILVPVMAGKPFGRDGRYGGFGFGGAFNLSYIRYGTDLSELVEKRSDGTTRAFAPLRGEKIIPSYGYFGSVRAGYRWIFFLGSFAAYWQDYGRFDLFGGESARLEGWTYLPSLALELRF